MQSKMLIFFTTHIYFDFHSLRRKTNINSSIYICIAIVDITALANIIITMLIISADDLGDVLIIT